MNERIQELMRQSMVEHQFDLRFSPEKFAELIIRECADLTRWQDYEMSNEQRIRLTVYKDIRNHFGVSE